MKHKFSVRRHMPWKLNTFAMQWSANGHRYAVGNEINLWLGQGLDVLVNGSRGYLDTALEFYGSQLKPVVLSVEPTRLRQRLLRRGRETSGEIEARIERAIRLQQVCPSNAAVIDNNRDLDSAVNELIRLVSDPV